jgi:hypothetical protein
LSFFFGSAHPDHNAKAIKDGEEVVLREIWLRRFKNPDDCIFPGRNCFCVIPPPGLCSSKMSVQPTMLAFQGNNHDLHVWRDTLALDRLQFHEKEWVMGDPAYWGGAKCITKYPMKKMCPLFHRPLPPHLKCNCPKGRLPFEKTYNTIFDGYRGRVEKIFSQVLHHRAFKG